MNPSRIFWVVDERAVANTNRGNEAIVPLRLQHPEPTFCIRVFPKFNIFYINLAIFELFIRTLLNKTP
uniref:Uncharacterized protein n=1 Tax=Heterorhabditis bacteriophora TaxID=37862 RepID=A0A1I7WHJ4_HETBA